MNTLITRHSKNIAVLVGIVLISLFLSNTFVFAQKSESLVVKPCVHEDGTKNGFNCWSKEITSIISEKSLSFGFKLIQELYENHPEFRPYCNGLTGRVATGIYETIPDYTSLKYTPETTFCNFGFYQQYPRGLLLETKSVEKAVAFCKHIGEQINKSVPGARAECFRGIGRALPFIKEELYGNADAMAQSATRGCKEFAPEGPDYDLCLSGIFNQIAVAQAQEEYELTVDRANPSSLCDRQSQEYKPRCYGSMKLAALSLVNIEEPQKAFEILKDAYGTDATLQISEILIKVAYERAQKSLNGNINLLEEIKIAATFPPPYAEKYIIGIALGLEKNSLPEQQPEIIINVCKSAAPHIPSLTMPTCMYIPIEYLRGSSSPSQFEKACQEIKKKLNVSCHVRNEENANHGSFF